MTVLPYYDWAVHADSANAAEQLRLSSSVEFGIDIREVGHFGESRKHIAVWQAFVEVTEKAVGRARDEKSEDYSGE